MSSSEHSRVCLLSPQKGVELRESHVKFDQTTTADCIHSFRAVLLLYLDQKQLRSSINRVLQGHLYVRCSARGLAAGHSAGGAHKVVRRGNRLAAAIAAAVEAIPLAQRLLTRLSRFQGVYVGDGDLLPNALRSAVSWSLLALNPVKPCQQDLYKRVRNVLDLTHDAVQARITFKTEWGSRQMTGSLLESSFVRRGEQSKTSMAGVGVRGQGYN